jgi:hypothetical protein
MADEDEGTAESTGESMEARLARLEGGLAALAAQRTPTSHAQAERNTARRLDEGSNIEDRVREEVNRIRRHEAEESERKASAAHREEMSRRVAELEKGRRASRSESERAPEAPVRGITRALWGRP